MNKNGVIAFCGSKGSGKSTSATILKEFVNAETEEIAIAGHLKEVCSKVFKIDYDKFINPDLKEVELDELTVLDSQNLVDLLLAFDVRNINSNEFIRPHLQRVLRTPRALLQYIGTEVLHPIDPLIHVKMAMKNKDANKLTIITDLRFLQEFNYFEENHTDEFLPVYVRNFMAESRASSDVHPSERQFELFKNKCIALNNNSTISDLRNGIMDLVKKFYE